MYLYLLSNFPCTRVISFALVTPGGSVFVTIRMDCSKMFMKPGDKKTNSVREQSIKIIKMEKIYLDSHVKTFY